MAAYEITQALIKVGRDSVLLGSSMGEAKKKIDASCVISPSAGIRD